MTTEPYGTTPLPAKGGVSIRYDPGEDVWDIAQQPKSQQIAAYEGIPSEDSIHGATVLDVNQHFVIYAVKKGLIRILHRHSTLRSLFRGHAGQTITDIQIFLDGDVLGSVGHDAATGNSTVIIWRVFERTPEIMSEKLLEITTNAFHISRLIWHPFNPNQFWIVHTTGDNDDDGNKKVASLVDTTRISTLPHATEQHAVCMFHQPNTIMDGVVSLAAPTASSLTDLDWSEKDVRHVLTVHQGGEIQLWDLRKVDPNPAANAATTLPACLCVIREEQPLSRCKFLPHESSSTKQPGDTTSYHTNCFLTAAHNNSEVTLWSPFGSNDDGLSASPPPTKLQVFGLQHPSPSYVLDICYGPSAPDGPPPALFVLMADQSQGKLFSWHIQSEWQEEKTLVSLVGCDFVVPFVTSYPMYSWSTQVQPAADISEDEMSEQGGLIFDMKLFSYQSTVVQCLTLTSFMCLPPARPWDASTSGVIVEELSQLQQLESSLVASSSPEMDMTGDFGDYDVGDDDDDDEAEVAAGTEEDFSEPPAASSLPVPDGLDSPAAAAPTAPSGGAFANWLGALAGKAPGPTPIPPPPIAQAEEQQQRQPSPPGPAVPAPAPPVAMPSSTTTMLTPADLFPNHPSITGVPAVTAAENSQPPPPQNTGAKKKNNKGKPRSKSPKAEQQQQTDNVTILQRNSEDNGTAPVAAPPGMAPSAGSAASSRELAGLFQKQQATMTQEIQKAIQREMKTTLVPLIDQKVRESVKQAVDPVLSSINAIGKNGVQVDHDRLVNAITEKVEAPLRAAFADNMKNALIPAFEAVSGQMFAQISSSLEGGMAQKNASDGASNIKLDEITNQLATMTALVAKLSSEVESLRSTMTDQSMRVRAESLASSAGIATAAEVQQVLEQDVVALLGQRQYEGAFTKALSASTVEMALYVCRHADLSDVLGGSSPSLSQPILLCLMHQLGTSVVASQDVNNLQTELEWLQEVSLSINPMDESMQRHLSGVLQQLITGINEKMARTDQQARRPLQRLLQVLRGVQVQ